MLLGQVFDHFVQKSPVSVMVRGLLEKVLCPQTLDDLFERSAKTQYTRELLFSTVVNLMSLVHSGIHPSIHAANPRISRGNRSFGHIDLQQNQWYRTEYQCGGASKKSPVKRKLQLGTSTQQCLICYQGIESRFLTVMRSQRANIVSKYCAKSAVPHYQVNHWLCLIQA